MSSSISSATATSPLPSKPPTVQSSAAGSSQPVATPSPTPKVTQPLPKATSNPSNVLVSGSIPVTQSSIASQVRIATPTPSLVAPNGTGNSSSAPAGIRELTSDKSDGSNYNSAGAPANSASTGVTVAIAMSAVAILIGAVLMFKLLSAHFRQRRGRQLLEDTFTVASTPLPTSSPKDQTNGGVGASPLSVARTSMSSSSGSPMTPTTYQRKYSVYSNDYGGYGHHTLQDSQLLKPEFVQSSQSFANSKTWDGSRPSLAPSWR